MEINEQNVNLLSEENKSKFAHFCIDHVFSQIKEKIYNSQCGKNERTLIECVELTEKWLKDPNSVNLSMFEELELANEQSTAKLFWRTFEPIDREDISQLVLGMNGFINTICFWLKNTTNILTLTSLLIASLQTCTLHWKGKIGEKEKEWQEKLLNLLVETQFHLKVS